MKKLILAAAVALFASTAVADKMSLDNGEEAIAYRKAAFSLLAANFGDLAARVSGKKAFDATIVSQRVANVSALAQMPWEAFAVAGSDKGKEQKPCRRCGAKQMILPPPSNSFWLSPSWMLRAQIRKNWKPLLVPLANPARVATTALRPDLWMWVAAAATLCHPAISR